MPNGDLEDAAEGDIGARIAAVNEGDLVFLRAPLPKPVHHHHNVLTMDERSLASGRAELHQYHAHLDRVPATQIVFREGRARPRDRLPAGYPQGLGGRATVQLRDIGPGARLCRRLQTQALPRGSDGTYHANSGPFMRRFLDGYYPMHVSMELRLRTDRLRFLDITPAAQPGFQVTSGLHGVTFDAWFEGRLQTRIRFRSTQRKRPAPG